MSDDPKVVAYYEFMSFYQLSGLYDCWLRQPGQYPKLQAALGLAPDHEWSKEERLNFLYGFRRFKAAFTRLNSEKLDVTPGEALMVWLELHPFSELESMQETELDRSLAAIWADVRLLTQQSPIQISTEATTQDKINWARLLGFGRITHLNVAFVHAFAPEKSAWTAAHELGREHLKQVMGASVTTTVYQCT